MITPLIHTKCTALGMTIDPPADLTRLHWEVSHLWLTPDGCWDDVPGWAKPFQNDQLGGGFHVYMLAIGLDGKPRTDQDLFVLGWPDGTAKFSPLPGSSWWGNVPINAGFNWEKGETGPYFARVNALSSSIVRGIGLPWPGYPWDRAQGLSTSFVGKSRFWDGKSYVGEMKYADVNVMGGQHTAFFIVAQEVAAQAPEPEPLPVKGQLQRVLDKAEAVGDRLAADDTRMSRAADVYLGIAAFLCATQFHGEQFTAWQEGAVLTSIGRTDDTAE